MVSFSQKGDFKRTEQMLKKASEKKYLNILSKYGQQGVSALSAATPKDTGLTAASWSYEIKNEGNGVSINFLNSHVEKGYANIAILLQFGHGTRNGGYVHGRDYINPAVRPIFDKIAKEVWEEVVGK